MNKTLVIMGHPDLSKGSLANRIIVDRMEEEPGVEVRNLAALYPDFAIDVEAEQAALLEADQVVFQFPIHWYSVPGILKEYIDRVLSYGFAYGSTGDKLKGKKLTVSMTIGGTEEEYGSEEYIPFSMEELMSPLKMTATLCGMPWADPVLSFEMIYIPDVYNVKEEVEARARDHADRLVAALDAEVVPSS